MSNAQQQVARMLALVPYLQHGRDISLRQVAEQFGVAPEVIVKDLRVLWMCGLPGLAGGSMIDIDFEAFEDDPDGVVHLSNADYLRRPMRLDSTQASALTVALRTLREASESDSGTVIDGILRKLETATTEGNMVVARAEAATAATNQAGTAAQLTSAITQDQQVDLTYYVPARDEVTHRRVEPHVLFERDGHRYLDAWCHAALAQRVFRLDRIDSVAVVDETRTRPIPSRVLVDSLFEPSTAHQVVTVAVTADGRWMADYYPVEGVVEAADGGLTLTMVIADRRWLYRVLLSVAPEARILTPQDWADDFAEHVADIAKIYLPTVTREV